MANDTEMAKGGEELQRCGGEVEEVEELNSRTKERKLGER